MPEQQLTPSTEASAGPRPDSLASSEGVADEGEAETASADDWPDKYRQRLRDEQAARSPAEHVQGCAQLGALSDYELRTVYGSQAGEDNTFDMFMAELGVKPTVDDYNLAIEIAIEESREMC